MLTLLLLTLVAVPVLVDVTLRRGHTTSELTLAHPVVELLNLSARP